MGAFQEEKNCFKVCNGIHHCHRNERTLVLGFKRKKILIVCCNATLEELLVVVAVVVPGLGFRGFRA
jgi:hypothetical protein